MVFESLVPRKSYQVIWNHKLRFSLLQYCLHMFRYNPSIRIDELILVVKNIALKTLSSNVIATTPQRLTPQMLLKSSVFVLISLMKRGIKLAAFQHGTGNKQQISIHSKERLSTWKTCNTKTNNRNNERRYILLSKHWNKRTQNSKLKYLNKDVFEIFCEYHIDFKNCANDILKIILNLQIIHLQKKLKGYKKNIMTKP